MKLTAQRTALIGSTISIILLSQGITFYGNISLFFAQIFWILYTTKENLFEMCILSWIYLLVAVIGIFGGY